MQKTKDKSEVRIKAIESQIKRHLRTLDTLETHGLESKTDPKKFTKDLDTFTKTVKKINLLFDEYKPLIEERARKKVAKYVKFFLQEIEKKLD